ncbi:hypothetical protein PoB_004108700 [Plakobranchus ocellatus]|uniref:Uncharacterized protein n=1 Tax=Plakobranchus ocellatus TaxID=259542 RepID=A0AAV4B660_9GAST|nr:hypothetical protein PoB_004108700 [Plakobranchus ocellatus]
MYFNNVLVQQSWKNPLGCAVLNEYSLVPKKLRRLACIWGQFARLAATELCIRIVTVSAVAIVTFDSQAAAGAECRNLVQLHALIAL